MSILIKGIKIPESCYECSGFFNKADYHQCYYDKDDRDLDELNVYATRPEWCPLIEIPTPHGRLIDADNIEYHFEVNENTAMEGCEFVTKGEIGRVPTVIEAEE